MNKARKGAALIMALIVVLAGGALITGIFDFIAQYARFTLKARTEYVDHTTLLNEVQAMKGKIISDNEKADETQHTSKLNSYYKDNSLVASGNLALSDLRFDNSKPDWYKLDAAVDGKGLSKQKVTVEVYDMYFESEWAENTLKTKPEEAALFPPVFKMKADVTTGNSSSGSGKDVGSLVGTREGTTVGLGVGDSSKTISDSLDPKCYGAYLIRAKLYDTDISKEKPIRIIEEAFVQIIKPD